MQRVSDESSNPLQRQRHEREALDRHISLVDVLQDVQEWMMRPYFVIAIRADEQEAVVTAANDDSLEQLEAAPPGPLQIIEAQDQGLHLSGKYPYKILHHERETIVRGLRVQFRCGRVFSQDQFEFRQDLNEDLRIGL
jgi:hypothetical protein